MICHSIYVKYIIVLDNIYIYIYIYIYTVLDNLSDIQYSLT